MANLRSSSATMAFNNWAGLLGQWIFKLTWVWITVTRISAASDLFSAVTWSPLLILQVLLLFLLHSSDPILHCDSDMNIPLDGTVIAEEDDELTGVSLPPLLPPPPPSDFLIFFWASRDWRSCSNSFTKSIAPPIMDAWSPLINEFGLGQEIY